MKIKRQLNTFKTRLRGRKREIERVNTYLKQNRWKKRVKHKNK